MSLTDRLAKAGGAADRPPDHDAAAPARHASNDPFATVKRAVHQSLIETLGPRLYDPQMSSESLERRVRQCLQETLAAQETPLTSADRGRVAQEVADEILGYGPIEPYLRDPGVTEIMVNGPALVYIEREGRLHPADCTFADDEHVRRTIEKIVARVGRRIDESSPMVDARLPDGSRVNAAIPPVAVDGPTLTVRKFGTEPYTVEDLIGFGTFSPWMADLLAACVRGRLNIIVSGGTGTGKTTTLNVLSSAIPEDERIITIEDAAELQLHQTHVVRLESRPPNIEGRGEITIRDLVRNSLRMRPDRIVVGEVRDAAALDMLQAMNTGHDGSITTVHANSPREAMYRLETMVLMAGYDLPVRAIREHISSAIDLIVHQARLRDGSRRVTHVTEVVGMEGDVITLQDLFLLDSTRGVDAEGRFLGDLQPTGLRPSFLKRLAERGVEIDPLAFIPGQAHLTAAGAWR